jgi:hypothetical protein
VSELNGLLQRHSAVGIEFVVVGGVADVLHGSSMVTRDLDVCASLNGENLQKLRDAFGEMKNRHRHLLCDNRGEEGRHRYRHSQYLPLH